MNERLRVNCNGLFIKDKNSRYRKVKYLEFLIKTSMDENSVKLMNPNIIEEYPALSYPSDDAIKIFEETLPDSLFDLNDCIGTEEQKNNVVFVYKRRDYIFVNNTLCRVIAWEV